MINIISIVLSEFWCCGLHDRKAVWPMKKLQLQNPLVCCELVVAVNVKWVEYSRVGTKFQPVLW